MKPQLTIDTQRHVHLALWKQPTLVSAIVILAGCLLVMAYGSVVYASSYTSGTSLHCAHGRVCNHHNLHENRSKKQQHQNRNNQTNHGRGNQNVVSNNPTIGRHGVIANNPTTAQHGRGLVTNNPFTQGTGNGNQGVANNPATQVISKRNVNVINTPLTQLANGNGRNQSTTFICVGHTKYGNRDLYKGHGTHQSLKDNKAGYSQKEQKGDVTFICM